MSFGGWLLSTVAVIGGEVDVVPAVSVAAAEKTCEPFATLVEFHASR